MANMIELVNKYLPVLDAQYKLESRTSILDVAPEFVQMTKDAKKVKIAKMRVDGLGDYSRQNGFTAGYADLTWEEHEFTQDRGRSIQIDDMDNEETFGMAFGRLAGEFQRLHVIPEIDAYRFAKYYEKAGTKLEITVTAGEIVSTIDDLDSMMDDKEIPEEDRLIFVAPTVFKLMMNDPTLSKSMSISGNEDKAVNKKFYYYNNHLIIKVPSTRFYTKIDLLDGKSVGAEAGGYKAADDAKSIGMMMIQRNAVIQLSKRRIARIWAPTKEQAAGTDGVNPNADAWKFDYRVYHDAWVLDNKVDGIAAAVITSATVTGIEVYTEDPDVEIAGGASAIDLNDVDAVQLLTETTVTGGASKAVTWKSSANDIASVDNAGNVIFHKPGEVTITATSVWDPTKTGKVTFTVV